MKKNIILLAVIAVLVGVGAYYLIYVQGSKEDTSGSGVDVVPPKNGTIPAQTEVQPKDKTQTMIGTSVEKRDIVAYHFGNGDKRLLFIGGTHGGYSWNTALVAYELVDYLRDNPETVPTGLSVTVIPVLNPDGLYKIVGTTTRSFTQADVPSLDKTISGRFNSNNVDLNRNFDCDWQSSGKWQNRTVSGGSAPFSEPESKALKAYVEATKPSAILVWYSAAGGVFSSSCDNGILPETSVITSAFATASGYPAFKSFDYYALTGDMVNWFAKMNIPAISVLLTDHTNTEWSKNLAGIKALLSHFAK